MESVGNFLAVIRFMSRSARFEAKTVSIIQRRNRSIREDEMLEYPPLAHWLLVGISKQDQQ